SSVVSTETALRAPSWCPAWRSNLRCPRTASRWGCCRPPSGVEIRSGVDETRHGSLPVAHWGWVYDYDDDDHGGGFTSGEFVLSDDGVLQRRSVISRYS